MSAGRVWTLGCLGHRGLKIVDWGLSWAGLGGIMWLEPCPCSSQAKGHRLHSSVACWPAGRQFPLGS